MCLAAIYWARIARITFGASRDDAAAVGFDDALIYNEVCLEPNQRKITISRHGREQAVKIMRQWPEFAAKQRY